MARRQKSGRTSWRYALALLAAAAALYVYYFASGELGGATPWLIGAIFLMVGLALGLRAWLVAVAAAGLFFVSVGYLIPPPALTWRPDGATVLPTTLMDEPGEPNLVRLRVAYALDAVVQDARSDREKVARLTAWAHGRFGHSADNQPSRPDPLTILQEGAAGKTFRCVEYSIVLAAAARSLGLSSRVVGLKRHDVETARFGAGHVVAEVWLPDERRWVMADGQWNALVEAEGRALNAVEVRQALATRARGLRAVPAEWPLPKEYYYLPWLQPYLFYFDYLVDQRFFVAEQERRPGRVMLVPVGAPEPQVQAGGFPLGPATYVHDPALFYRAPD